MILHLCSAGTQGASNLSSIIILAADTATMQPAALAESLAVFHTIAQMCSHHVENQNATHNFCENLMAHLTLPTLITHILDVSKDLDEVQHAVDMAHGHHTVLCWTVLVWQCCECTAIWIGKLSESLTMDCATISDLMAVLIRVTCAIKLPEVRTLVTRYATPITILPSNPSWLIWCAEYESEFFHQHRNCSQLHLAG